MVMKTLHYASGEKEERNFLEARLAMEKGWVVLAQESLSHFRQRMWSLGASRILTTSGSSCWRASARSVGHLEGSRRLVVYGSRSGEGGTE